MRTEEETDSSHRPSSILRNVRCLQIMRLQLWKAGTFKVQCSCIFSRQTSHSDQVRGISSNTYWYV